jgi:hypothetical protein
MENGESEDLLVPTPRSGQTLDETLSIVPSSAGTVTVTSGDTMTGVPAISIPETFTAGGQRDVTIPVAPGSDGAQDFTISSTMATTITSSSVAPSPVLLDGSAGASNIAAASVTSLLPDRTDSRLFIDSRAGQRLRVTFQYETSSDGYLEINRDAANGWTGVATYGPTDGSWRQATFTSTSSSSYTEFGAYAPTSVVNIRDIQSLPTK